MLRSGHAVTWVGRVPFKHVAPMDVVACTAESPGGTRSTQQRFVWYLCSRDVRKYMRVLGVPASNANYVCERAAVAKGSQALAICKGRCQESRALRKPCVPVADRRGGTLHSGQWPLSAWTAFSRRTQDARTRDQHAHTNDCRAAPVDERHMLSSSPF